MAELVASCMYFVSHLVRIRLNVCVLSIDGLRKVVIIESVLVIRCIFEMKAYHVLYNYLFSWSLVFAFFKGGLFCIHLILQFWFI